ncbi:MAG: Fe-S cluster assembly protein SufD [Gemmatimonadales bacterium]|nr:Fe-S cluster assembly protein SufD [Gemmatimonadales bacterium]
MVGVAEYVAAHGAFAGNGAAKAPEWLKDLRQEGIGRFSTLGFPTTKQETWRFTSVASLIESRFELAQPVRDARYPSRAAIDASLLGDTAAHRLVFLNGHFAPSLSRVGGLPVGVQITNLAAAVRSDPELTRRHLGTYVEFADRPFAALNTAFVQDGAFVHVPSNVTVDEPVQVLFLTAAGGKRIVTHPRSLIIVDRGARVTLVETYAAVPGEAGTYWTNAITEVAVADGGRAECYRVQREAPDAYHVAATATHQGRDSTVNVHTVAFGAVLARHDIGGVLAGSGGALILNGLYLLSGAQHTDHHTTIDHAAPHCESHEYFNGVLDGRSRGVFTGRIIVRPGAQKTDSKQTNNNLLLSTDAHADSQPQLEIYADDVKCTHGSTVGPLDPRALFYLQSRGLAEAQARRLLTYGFGAEILGRMQIAPLRARLDQIVRDRLAES